MTGLENLLTALKSQIAAYEETDRDATDLRFIRELVETLLAERQEAQP